MSGMCSGKFFYENGGLHLCATLTFNVKSIKDSSEDEATRRTERNAAIRTSSSPLDHSSKHVCRSHSAISQVGRE